MQQEYCDAYNGEQPATEHNLQLSRPAARRARVSHLLLRKSNMDPDLRSLHIIEVLVRMYSEKRKDIVQEEPLRKRRKRHHGMLLNLASFQNHTYKDKDDAIADSVAESVTDDVHII
jgi:hypothetical protein